MLSELYIENIAVIEKAEIHFNAGLNVLTGETGAGKSIVIDAIHAILGERTSKEIVRTGCDRALVTAVFQETNSAVQNAVKEFGFSTEEDGSLLLQREISLGGKGSCRINGRPATVSMLRELGVHLINIHGQNESYALLSPNLHISYLDRLGELTGLLAEYQEVYQRLRALQRELESSNLDDAEKARRVDLLQYQIQELEEADLQAGEQEELTQRRSLYLNSERIATALQGARDAINGEEDYAGALQALEGVAASLEEAARFAPSLTSLSTRMRNLIYELEDCGAELRDAAAQIEYDPADLEELELRLDVIYRLERKYGSTIPEMLAFLEQAKAELQGIAFSDERRQQLEQEEKNTLETAGQLARQLSERRRATARIFVEQVKKELTFLDMPGVRLQVAQKQAPLNSLGCDDIQFLISTNPGEPPKPIAKIASGGELSRMMLAIKNVLAGQDEVDTLIFDEVDTGVSGSAAQKVGLKLREASKNRQVICVTHSAQIAALADEHLLIQKKVRDGRTYTSVKPLSFTGRTEELARILGGVKITNLTLQSASEMLRLAGISEEA